MLYNHDRYLLFGWKWKSCKNTYLKINTTLFCFFFLILCFFSVWVKQIFDIDWLHVFSFLYSKTSILHFTIDLNLYKFTSFATYCWSVPQLWFKNSVSFVTFFELDSQVNWIRRLVKFAESLWFSYFSQNLHHNFFRGVFKPCQTSNIADYNC